MSLKKYNLEIIIHDLSDIYKRLNTAFSGEEQKNYYKFD